MEQGRNAHMSWMTAIMALGLLLALPVGSMALPIGSTHATHPATASLSLVVAPSGAAHLATAIHPSAAPHPADTYPRTVLIETFTGVWCIHCPAESQALYDIDGHASKTTVIVAELHSCAIPGNCLDNYVPPDGTTDTRGSYYTVCGYPDVFVDGLYDVCGATNSQPQMENEYTQEIANASAVPGNVSLAQNAFLSAGGVTAFTTIHSGVTGSYNEVTYLMEYIGKRNQSTGYGPHDVGYVIRSTLHNGPVALTAGTSTEVSSLGALNATWNAQNLSVVSLVQQNSTRIIQNSNFAPVTSMITGVTANNTNLSSGGTATITVHVTNSTTGAILAGAAVNLSDDQGGMFNPSGGVTTATGDFTSSYTAPNVASIQPVVVTAAVTASGYTLGSGTTTLTVNPIYAPGAATGLTVVPDIGQFVLSWSAPTTGSGGVSYDVTTAPSAAGPYTAIANTGTTSYTFADLTPGQTLWVQVVSKNTAGYGPSSATQVVTSMTVVPQGLPGYTGFWFAVGTQNFSAPTATNLNIFVGTGPLFFDFGAKSYAWLPDPTIATEVLVGTTPFTIDLGFLARLATLSGTVSPTGAVVTFGVDTLTVSGGHFSWNGPSGTYTLNATLSGYTASTRAVTLTPGNTTPVTVELTPVASGGGGASSSADNGMLLEVAVIGAVFVAAAIIVLAVVVSRSRRNRPPENGEA